jgi:alpha-galactosidase/6-phospho-beta-glucosidase family protein
MIELVDKNGISVELPASIRHHFKLFDLIEATNETQTVHVDIFYSYHLRDVLNILKFDEEEAQSRQVKNILDNGIQYFMACLKVCEYLQSGLLSQLFKNCLASRLNEMCW